MKSSGKTAPSKDLLRIFADLDEFREGAGAEFTRTLDTSLQNLRTFPNMSPMFDRPMRRLVVGNSGYGLFYTVEARGIIVHALIHLRQDPATILAKIRDLLDLR